MSTTKQELVKMARMCGLPLTGTKSAMIESLKQAGAEKSPLASGPKELVAIDVGLKNFSLARMRTEQGNGRLPQILQWFKLDLPKFTGFPERLDPVVLSGITERALFDLVLGPSVPDIIVIERQRYRSAGHAAVQESVLKSNAVEFMMFSAMQTLKRLGKLDSKVVSSNPATMAHYWTDYYYDAREDVKSKVARMMLVDEWMRSLLAGDNSALAPPFELSSHLQRELGSDTPRPSLTGGNRGPSRRVFEAMALLNSLNTDKYKVPLDLDSGAKKGDDVTDSLLHGLAYVQFEQAKQDLRDRISAL